MNDVDAAKIVALAQAWQAMRPLADAPTVAHKADVGDDGATPAKPPAAFPVAGARARKKRGRQAT